MRSKKRLKELIGELWICFSKIPKYIQDKEKDFATFDRMGIIWTEINEILGCVYE
jgi:hypothetical protein